MEKFTVKREVSPGANSSKWVMEISQNTIGVEHPDDYDFEKLPVKVLQMADLVGFEPDEKMDSISSASKVTDMTEMILIGTYVEPPILVRRYQNGYQIVDGHHRFHAHRLAGAAHIEARVIPEGDITYIDSR